MGGWMYAAMQYLSNFGAMVSDKALPYKGIFMDYMEPTPSCDVDLLNSKLEVISFSTLFNSRSSNIQFFRCANKAN